MSAAVSLQVFGQDSLAVRSETHASVPDKISLLVYARVINESGGSYRVDENIVGNFRLNKLFRLEAGFRLGERPQNFDSYYHYKIELQTAYFRKTVRLIARLSDNVIKYPSPAFSKTNYLLIAEGRYPLSNTVSLMGAAGYVVTFQQNGVQDGRPSTEGVQNNYPTFKVAVRYDLHHKGFLEAAYGAYDVFNPYVLNAPFTQIAFDYDFSPSVSLYSYFRYQFNNSFTEPLNEFLGLGVRLHLVKG